MPDEIATSELQFLENPIMNTTTLATSSTSSNSGKVSLTTSTDSQYNDIIGADSGSGQSQTQFLSAFTDTDYQLITSLLLLGIFILNLFDLLRRLGSKRDL